MKTHISLCAGLLLAVAAGQPLAMNLAAAETPTPPPGDYVSFRIAVDSPQIAPFPKTPWILSGGVANNGVAQLDNHVVYPGFDWSKTLLIREGQLSLTGKILKGQFKIYGPSNNLSTWTLDGVVDGGKATGTYTMTQKCLADKKEATSASGKFNGSAVSGAELSKTNAIATGKDWPCWSGPTIYMAATPTGQKLVEDLTQARLIWRSQVALGRCTGNFGHPTPADYFNWQFGAGGASAIVADGKVFVTQWFPDGKEYDADYLKQLETAMDAIGIKEIPLGIKLNASKTSHDWYACMDAATGRTLWTAEFPEETGGYRTERYSVDHKTGPNGLTPAYGSGKLFGLHLSGYLRAMDAKTGKLVWKQKIPEASTVSQGRGNNECVGFIGGAVLVLGHAFDPETGAELWKSSWSTVAEPLRWNHGGKEYAILTKGQYTGALDCVEPKTGKVMWSLGAEQAMGPPPGFAVGLPGVCGDTMVVLKAAGATDPQKGGATTFTAYHMNLQKVEKLWEVPNTVGATNHGIQIVGKYVAVSGPSKGCLLDLATGKTVSEFELGGPGNGGHMQAAEDRIFVQLDGAHGFININMAGGEPAAFKGMGKTWSPTIPHTSSYAWKMQSHPIVDGRMYLRGADGIYCYDLRKSPGMLKVEAVLEAAKTSDSAAVDGLLPLCADTDPLVRRSAADALAQRVAAGRIADRKAKILAALANLSADADTEVTAAAGAALSSLGAEGLDALLANLKNPNAAVRQEAIRAIGRMQDVKDPRLDQALAAGLSEPALTMAALGAIHARGVATADLANAVAACVDSADRDVVWRAVETLLRISPDGRLPSVRPKGLTKALVEATGMPDPTVGNGAASMIRAMGQDEAIRAFSEVLKGESALAGIRACTALSSMGKPAAVTIPLIQQAKTKWAGSRSFVSAADKALAAIEKAP